MRWSYLLIHPSNIKLFITFLFLLAVIKISWTVVKVTLFNFYAKQLIMHGSIWCYMYQVKFPLAHTSASVKCEGHSLKNKLALCLPKVNYLGFVTSKACFRIHCAEILFYCFFLVAKILQANNKQKTALNYPFRFPTNV